MIKSTYSIADAIGRSAAEVRCSEPKEAFAGQAGPGGHAKACPRARDYRRQRGRDDPGAPPSTQRGAHPETPVRNMRRRASSHLSAYQGLATLCAGIGQGKATLMGLCGADGDDVSRTSAHSRAIAG